MAIKSALGACSLAYRPGFAASTFAAALRAVRDDPADPQRQVAAPAYLGRLDASIIPQAAVRAGLSHAEVSALPRLAPTAGDTVHDVILVPHNGQQTVLFAHYSRNSSRPTGS